MAYIPKPWKVVDLYDVQAGSLRIRQNYEPGAYDNGDLECAKDNAALIAAAPELLEALQAITGPDGHIWHGTPGGPCTGECKDIRAAIAKTEGKG